MTKEEEEESSFDGSIDGSIIDGSIDQNSSVHESFSDHENSLINEEDSLGDSSPTPSQPIAQPKELKEKEIGKLAQEKPQSNEFPSQKFETPNLSFTSDLDFQSPSPYSNTFKTTATSVLNKISKYLADKGYTVVDISSTDCQPELNTLSALAVEAWGQTILQAVMEMGDRLDQQKSTVRMVSDAVRLETNTKDMLSEKVKELQSVIKASESRERLLKEKIHELENIKYQESKQDKNTDKELKKKFKNLELQIQESERKFRAKEIEYEKLRNKLTNLANKDRQSLNQSRQILSQIDQGDLSFLVNQTMNSSALDDSFASNQSSSSKGSSVNQSYVTSKGVDQKKYVLQSNQLKEKNTQLLTIIDIIIQNRQEIISKNKELEYLNQQLLQQIKSLSNNQPQQTNDTSFTQEEQMNKLLMQQLQDENQQLQHNKEELESAISTLQQQSSHLKKQLIQIQETNENLQIELQSLPSKKQMNQLIYEKNELETKLYQILQLKTHQQEVRSLQKHVKSNAPTSSETNNRKYFDTKELISNDQKNFQLNLHLIANLPTNIMKEILQMVCRELDISDISDIQDCLHKLKSVVRTVPRMQRFMSNIITFLQHKHDLLVTKLNDIHSTSHQDWIHEKKEDPMEESYLILQRWWKLIQKSIELEMFEESFLYEMFRFEQLINTPWERANTPTLSEEYLQGYWRDDGKIEFVLRDKKLLIQSMRDIIDCHVDIMNHTQTQITIEEYIKQRPDIIINRILNHVSYLYDIKSINGIIPKLNEVYIFYEETNNFFNSIRTLLKKQHPSKIDNINGKNKSLNASERISYHELFNDLTQIVTDYLQLN